VSRVHWKIQRSPIAVLKFMHPTLQVAGINGFGEVSLFGLLLCIKGRKQLFKELFEAAHDGPPLWGASQGNKG
jgi:hypothetical protein